MNFEETILLNEYNRTIVQKTLILSINFVVFTKSILKNKTLSVLTGVTSHHI
jgi:hypothetical protein